MTITPALDTAVPDYDVEETRLTFASRRGHYIYFERNEDLGDILAKDRALDLGTDSRRFVVVALGVDGECDDFVLVQADTADTGAVVGDALDALRPVYQRLQR